jgi:hypothetical protein
LKALARGDREEEGISGGDRRSFREGEGHGKEQGTSPHRGEAEFLTGDYLNGDGDDGGGGRFGEKWSSSGSASSLKLTRGIGLRVD